jgi:catechol 2,3-dioxygenase-like lactoylglutathione lyase family enzyme
MTFFPWEKVALGRIGPGPSTTTAFSVPEGTPGCWQHHFKSRGTDSTITRISADAERLSLRDPDRMQLDLVASSTSDPAHQRDHQHPRPADGVEDILDGCPQAEDEDGQSDALSGRRASTAARGPC